MATLYIATNAPMQTTAAPTKQPTGTALRTMLQIAVSSSRPIKVVEWGCSFDGSAAATPIQVELLQTDVGASGTNFNAFSANAVQPFDDPNAPASTITLTSSGYSSGAPSVEGTITATRNGDLQLLPPTGPYLKQWPLGREWQVPVSKFLRVRMTAGASVGAYVYVVWEE